MRRMITTALVLVNLAGAAYGQINDDFDVDSSADYTIVDSTSPSDGSVTFAYDYSADSIPPAPGSGGTTLGLRITANDTLQATEAITVFHNTLLTGWVRCSLTVDFYAGVTGTGGTTEHTHVGIAGDGVTPNAIFSSGSGHFLAMTGEGGSSSDYRHFIPSFGPVPSGDPSYLNSTNTTNATGDTYQTIFPTPPHDFAGSPGNSWVTLQIEIDATTIAYSLDSQSTAGFTPIIQAATETMDGYVSLGQVDSFSSVANPFQSQFVVFDNLEVACEIPVELQSFVVE